MTNKPDFVNDFLARARVDHLSLTTLTTLTETSIMHKRFVQFFGFVNVVNDVNAILPTRARGGDLEVLLMALTVDGCLAALVGFGYDFSLRDDGAVSVKQPAKRNPQAAEMMAYLALHKVEVRAAVKARRETQTELAVEPEGIIAGVADDRAPSVILPEPDADGIVRLVRVSPEVAFAAGDLINDGKAELIGKVIYRRISNVFDVTYRVVES